MRIIGFLLGLALFISGTFVDFPTWAAVRDVLTFGEGANFTIGMMLMVITIVWDLATTSPS